MATWNYQSPSSFSGTLDTNVDGNIIGTSDTATAAGTKTFSVKGFKTPADGSTDTSIPGTFGTVIGNMFGVTFQTAKAKTEAALEEV